MNSEDENVLSYDFPSINGFAIFIPDSFNFLLRAFGIMYRPMIHIVLLCTVNLSKWHNFLWIKSYISSNEPFSPDKKVLKF